jgi:hypothetical protein
MGVSMEYEYAADTSLGRRGIFNPLLLAVAIALAEETNMDPLDLLAASSEAEPAYELSAA